MHNQIACTTGGYRGSDLGRVFAGLARAGFKHLELTAIPGPAARLPVERLSKDAIIALQASMASHGLTPISLSGHCDLSTLEGMELFKKRLNFARDLGVRIVNTGATKGESREDVDKFFAHMKDLIPYAHDCGVRIALETHGGLTGTAQDCLRTLERLNSDWVGINYDTANVIYYRGVRPEEDIWSIAPWVIHVHLKDKHGGKGVYDFPPLGEGTIQFGSILAALEASGYTGPYSAEIEMDLDLSPEEEDQTMGRIHEFMQRLTGELARSRRQDEAHQ